MRVEEDVAAHSSIQQTLDLDQVVRDHRADVFAACEYALEIKDPYLAQVVRRVEAGETTIDHVQLEEPLRMLGVPLRFSQRCKGMPRSVTRTGE